MMSPVAVAVTECAENPPLFRQPEKRLNRRANLEVDVTLESDHNFYAGLSSNVAEGGLFVATHALLPVGTRLMVRFSLPGSTSSSEALVEVRWVREECFSRLPPGMGLRFLQLDPSALLAIRRFVAERDTILFED